MKYIICLILLLIILAFAVQNEKKLPIPDSYKQVIVEDSIPKKRKYYGKPKPKPKLRSERIYKLDEVEKIPYILGCDMSMTPFQIQSYTNQKLERFIEEQLQLYKKVYPNSLCEITTATLEFIINKKGEVILPKNYQNIPQYCHNLEPFLLERLQQKLKNWKAGQENGKEVSVKILLPLKIDIDEQGKYQVTKDTIYEMVDRMPRFSGCEEIVGNDGDKKQCADKKMLDYIYKTIRYPTTIRESGVEGVVVIRFVIDEKGRIVVPNILRDIGQDCGKNALEVVKKMNQLPKRWTSGKQNGKAVKVQFNLPVRYKLDG